MFILGVLFLFFIEDLVASEIDFNTCEHNVKVFNATPGIPGDIYSPGYLEGKNYPDSFNCLYTIIAPPEYQIRLTFVDFDVEVAMQCGSDMLIVMDSYTKSYNIFCGNRSYRDIISSNNTLMLVFRSDFMKNFRGFHFRYKASLSPKLCNEKDGFKECRNRYCYDVTDACDGYDDCEDGTDEENCSLPLPVTRCGKRNKSYSSELGQDRIVGGREAEEGSWPWHVSLQQSTTYPNGNMCGGTLINAQWVLSASHCFGGGAGPSNYRVNLGMHNQLYRNKYEQIRHVEKIFIYPNLTTDQIGDKSIAAGDYALLKLNAPVTFTNRVRPACLPDKNLKLDPGTTCMATGWGYTYGTGSPDVLKEIDLTIEDREVCKNSMVDIDDKVMICTKHYQGKFDVCNGDSGGPLICKINNEWQVVGVTSLGTDASVCGAVGIHTIYARVSTIVPWINKIVDENR